MSLDIKQKSNIETSETDESFALGDNSEFSFDQVDSDEFVDLGEDLNDQPEMIRVMDCICPKCNEKTEIDLAQMPENGFVLTCSSCNKQIHVLRESCAGRAKRKSFEINCANCGGQLDQHAHCHSCGLIFPDYFVTVNPEDARRQARSKLLHKRLAALKEINFSFMPVFTRSSSDVSSGYTPTSRKSSTATGFSSLFTKRLTISLIGLSVVVLMVVAGVLTYNSYMSRKAYAENYVSVLYGIKMGVDTNIKSCESMKAEWELATTSGRSFSAILSNKDETKSIKLRSEVEKQLQKINNPPPKFAQAKEKLLVMHKIYLDSETLIQSKPNSIQELSSSIENINKKMNSSSQELKSVIPEELKLELVAAKLKYRGMKDF